MAHEKTCYVCGKEYHYCPNCAEYASSPTWKNMYDEEDCKLIDETLNAFWFGHITKDDANEKLAGVNLNKVTNKNLLVAVKKLKENEKKSFKQKNADD